jgi:tetratricopeptide (TPR) repeat protein
MVDSLFSIGTVHYRLNDLEQAGRWFARLLEVAPDHLGAHYHLGKIALQRGDSKSAVVHLERCVALDPANKGARYQLARAYRSTGEPEKAARELAAFQALGAGADSDAEWRAERLDRIGARPERRRPSP